MKRHARPGWLILMLATAAIAAVAAQAQAQKPVTERSAVAALDATKKTVEVRNFRIGGKYDLADPKAWADGGVGGKPGLEIGDAAALERRDQEGGGERRPPVAGLGQRT